MDNLSNRIKHKLSELGVSLVYVFGSYAEETNRPDSDVDIGVVFQKQPDQGLISKKYGGLYDIFTDVFAGKKVDIVFLERANLELRFDVISHGLLIFESSTGEHFDFEEKTSLLYADFKPILKMFDEAVFNRIS